MGTAFLIVVMLVCIGCVAVMLVALALIAAELFNEIDDWENKKGDD